jgi:hypothetical protein
MEPNKFVIAVDESEFAKKAFDKALQVIKKGDELVLLHAVEIQHTSMFDPLHEPIGCFNVN